MQHQVWLGAIGSVILEIQILSEWVSKRSSYLAICSTGVDWTCANYSTDQHDPGSALSPILGQCQSCGSLGTLQFNLYIGEKIAGQVQVFRVSLVTFVRWKIGSWEGLGKRVIVE